MSFRLFSRALLPFALLLGSAPSLPAALRDQFTGAESRQLQREARLVFELLQNYHYSGRSFIGLKNPELLEGFLRELDPRAEYFLQSDGEFVARRFGQTLKSVYLARGDLQPAFEIFELFQERVSQRARWIAARLERDFAFTDDESIDPTAAPRPAKDAAEADALWEKSLKDAVLHEVVAGRSVEAARAEVARRYAEFERTVRSIDPHVVRERFFDSVIRTYDPHSGYFSADSAHEFALMMGQPLAGVGLHLAKRQGRCVVEALAAGGAADLHSNLEPGDTILALAEGDAAWRETVTLRLREIVAAVRGAAGSTLRLAYRPAGTDERKEVTLARAEIVSAEHRASGGVVRLHDGRGAARRIGWVRLPTFYAAGPKGDQSSSATRDVRELLAAMEVEALDGLVLDLRGNPGGALTEAVGLSALFLAPGAAVLHTRQPDGKSEELRTPDDASPLYSGPLIVLTSADSASASEVLAGALKFHRRAVVVGAASTFGKGTMQNYVELAAASRLPKSETGAWGTLRLTAQRFYLPDGGAVQRAGVAADIALPGAGGPASPREAELRGALAEDKLAVTARAAIAAPAALARTTPELLERLRDRARADLASLPEWQLWRDEAELRDRLRPAKRSLRLAVRADEHAADQARREELRRTRRALAASAAPSLEAVELAMIAAGRAASDAALRAHPATSSFAVAMVETDKRRARKLRASQVDFSRFSGDTAALAEAFARGAGRAVDPGAIGGALREFILQTERSPLTWRRCFSGRLTEPDWSAEQIDRGLAALLAALPEIDPELKREHVALDIPLREALRLAAAWSEDASSASSP